jgi:flagellar basal-body rod protein FlgB
MKPIFDKTTDALAASLDFRSLRQNVTASNIANAETPGYHAKVVEFEDSLDRAIRLQGMSKVNGADPDEIAIGENAIAKVSPDVYDNPQAAVTNDGNTVDLEQEMANLKENTIIYKAALQLMNKKLGALKYAISEGGR